MSYYCSVCGDYVKPAVYCGKCGLCTAHCICASTRFIVAILLLLVLPAICAGQEGSVSVYCPPMPVRKVGIGFKLWQCDRIVCVATIRFPASKKKVDDLMPGPFGHGWHWEKQKERVVAVEEFVIEPTYVHVANLRTAYVDACDSTGTAKEGTYFSLRLPREPVVLTGLGVRTALAITAKGYIVEPDGTEWQAEVTYPDCRTRLVRPGLRIAEEITARGKMWRIER